MKKWVHYKYDFFEHHHFQKKTELETLHADEETGVLQAELPTDLLKESGDLNYR